MSDIYLCQGALFWDASINLPLTYSVTSHRRASAGASHFGGHQGTFIVGTRPPISYRNTGALTTNAYGMHTHPTRTPAFPRHRTHIQLRPRCPPAASQHPHVNLRTTAITPSWNTHPAPISTADCFWAGFIRIPPRGPLPFQPRQPWHHHALASALTREYACASKSWFGHNAPDGSLAPVCGASLVRVASLRMSFYPSPVNPTTKIPTHNPDWRSEQWYSKQIYPPQP